jgi:hypothetical protein
MVENRPTQNATPPDWNRPEFVKSGEARPDVDTDADMFADEIATGDSGDETAPQPAPQAAAAADDPIEAHATSQIEAAAIDPALPIIDLPASEYSDAEPLHSEPADTSEPPRPSAADEPPRASLASRTLLPALSGAVAAAIVVGAVWVAAAPNLTAPPAAPQADSRATDALAARLASLENRPPVGPATQPDPALATRLAALEQAVASLGSSGTTAPAAAAPDQAAAAADPALTERIGTLETSLASLRDDLAATKSQAEQLASSVATAKPAAAEPAAPQVSAADLAAITDRLSQVERAAKAPAPAAAVPASDVPLRRVLAATLLELAVRQSEPYSTALDTARGVAADPAALKPLEGFAVSGVPSNAALGRELIALLPKLAASQQTSGTAAGLLDRLQAGADRLVRVQRTDAVPGIDRAAIVSRAAAAAQRNDIAEAKRELSALPPADRAPVQAWIETSDARDAALAASRQFATAALAALPKTSQ